MILEYLKVTNFGCLGEDNYLELSNQGMVFLQGENRDAPTYTDSNLSGKSTVFEAICQGLYGKNCKGVQGKNIIRNGASECSIEMGVNGNTILREYSKKDKNMLYFNGKETVQDVIDQELGMKFSQFLNFSMFYDDTCKVNEPLFASGTNTQRFSILSPFLSTPVWEEGLSKAEKDLNRIDADILKQQSSIIEFISHIKKNRALWQSYRRFIRTIDRELQELDNRYNEEVKSREQVYNDIVSNIHCLEKQKPVIPEVLLETVVQNKQQIQEYKKQITIGKDRVQQLRIEISRLTNILTSDTQKVTGLKNEITRYSNLMRQSKCPTCEQNIAGEILNQYNSYIQQYNESIKVLEAKAQDSLFKKTNYEQAVTQAEYTIEDYENKISKLQEDIESINKDIADINLEKTRIETTLRQQQQRLSELQQEQITARKRYSEERDEVLKKDSIYKQEVNNFKSCIKANIKYIREFRGILGGLERQKLNIQFYTKIGFKPQGCPSIELRELFPTINLYLQSILPDILDSKYNIEVSGRRELKSAKGMKNEISLMLDNDFTSCSRSERRRIELLIQLALSEMLPGCNCKFFDELLSSLDNKGIDLILDTFRNMLSEKLTSIFVISHKPVSYAFDKYVTVVREKGVSRIVI